MSEILVSIGLVTWNSAEKLPATLAALKIQNYRHIELIVVDNASADNSIAQTCAYFPNARIIKNKENRGFCGGHNQAICHSKGKYYLPLNPDVEMMPEYIVELVDTLESHPDCGSAAGKLLRQPGVIDTTGLFINRRRQQYLRGHGESDHGQFETPGEVFGVDGAAPLYRREMLEDIQINGQYFDELFFAHKEDVDLAWRARLMGWGCWYQPRALAYHERNFKPNQRSSISPEIRMHAVKNRYLLLLKNETSVGFLEDGLQIFWYDLKIFIYLCLFERSSLQAFKFIWQHLPEILAYRRKITNNLRVDTGRFLSWFRKNGNV